MTVDIVTTVAAGLLLAVAAFGTVFPILPGSPIAMVTLLVWGWILGSTASWTAGTIGLVLATIGFSASLLLTGRKLKQRRIPRRSILAGVVAGVIGMFVIPFVGLFIGFAGGLFLAESVRQKDTRSAWRSSLEALKAMGLGMIVEFFMVALASSVWVIGVIVHFITA